MKKLIGAIFILIALGGCDSKSNNSDPKYAGIDEAIEKAIKQTKKLPTYSNLRAQDKIAYSEQIFGRFLYSNRRSLVEGERPASLMKFGEQKSKSCVKDDIVKSFGDYAGEPENKQMIDEMMIFVPFFCENGVPAPEEKYTEQTKILEAYATQKFKDEFLTK